MGGPPRFERASAWGTTKVPTSGDCVQLWHDYPSKQRLLTIVMTLKNTECTFVILGATGDLTKRKLIPAIYKLIEDHKIQNFAVVGLSFIDATVATVLESSRPFMGTGVDEKIWQQLHDNSYYYTFDFYKDADFIQLKEQLIVIEQRHNLCGNRLFYLATMPEHFSIITENLAKHGIVERPQYHQQNCADNSHAWSRVVYEKPFGQDLASAQKINRSIADLFCESQAYRIDHYLGKELVGNIALLRFTNLIFLPLWNNQYINSVQIVLNEKIGIQGRGEYYDQYGALKDMVQNHMLQMLALVAMEAPTELSGEHIRNAKVAVLEKSTITDALLGQYEGYQQEKGVKPHSTTETFAALKLAIDNDRWRGVPFYFKTGKNLTASDVSIHIEFKMPPCLLVQDCPANPNYLTLQIQPDEGFFLELNAKVPGESYSVTPVKMDFCHSCLFGPNTAQAYEILLADCIRGDQSVFVRFDEIELSWKIIDSLNERTIPLHSYTPGTNGPEALSEWSKKHNLEWRA